MTNPPIPFIPETAPFNPEQRAWLNGYLAGLFARTVPDSGSMPQATLAAPKPAVTILFASQTGNAEALSKQMALRLTKSGFAPQIADIAQYPPEKMAEEERLLVIASTYGEGEPPDSAKDFWSKITNGSAPKLVKTKFSVLALGDTNYPHFCRFGRELDRRLEEIGGARIADRVECDVDFEPPFEKWLSEVLPKLAPTSDTATMPMSTPTPENTPAAEIAEAKPAAYSRKNPFPARLIANHRLNGPGSDKDTRHIEISIEGSGMNYEAGDALAVQPKNRPCVVDEMLDHLGFSGGEPVPGSAGIDKPLRWALLEDYEMSKIHKQLLIELAVRSGDEAFKDQIEKATPGDMARLTWGNEVMDFLKRFPTARFEPREFIGLLKKLHPRLYSISSSPKAHPGQVHLTVGVVRYDREGRVHKGTCSAWLAERVEPATPVPVFIQPNKHFRPPADPALPMIMIGPGTGIAPFRAFLEERREIGASGKNWLFFGERQEKTDFLYRDELLGMVEEKLLTRLDLAFSRDQIKKIYVQTRMMEHATELYDWLEQGAHFYICGDAARMAKDVEAALLSIIESVGNKTPEAAAEYLKALSSAHRFHRDVY